MDIIKSIEHEQLKNKIPTLNQTFTVRKNSYGVGVEKTFLIHSPLVEKVELVRVGKARRAKLYYLRDRVGKAAKTKEQIGARIENREIVVKEDLAEEPVSEETTTPVESAPEEAPAVETENVTVQEVVDTVKEEPVEDKKEEPVEDKKEEPVENKEAEKEEKKAE